MIPTRNFGKTGAKISALGLGGHHLAQTRDENESLQIVQEAVDGGITFFDNCWEYHLGLSELLLGKGLTGRRDKVFLMTKVCTHGREKILAMEMLEQSLRRLRTDHLDLWQIHGVSFDNDPDLFIRPNGAAEALEAAKKQGKVRFTGFTGHKDPRLHLKMLATGFPFDAVQMPLNPFDASFRSFEQNVLPRVRERGMAVIGMKPLSGAGEPITLGVVSAEEALRYAMSLPVATTVTGVDKLDVLRQNLRIAQNFEPMNSAEADALRARCRSVAGDGRFELWQQSENVVFEQSRNVVLTAPKFGDAGRTTTNDASRSRPAGDAKESEEETDYAERGSRGAWLEHSAGAAIAGGTARER